MKKFLACLICFVFLLDLIVGCETSYNRNMGETEPSIDSVYPQPNIVEYRKNIDEGYFYIVDKNTNTVYMIFYGLHQFGITDAVWPDGKPVTVEELENNFKR